MSITQSITDLPTPPSRSSPVDFVTRADAFVDALDDLASEINTWAGQANGTAATVNVDAAAAAAAAITAEEAADAAVAQGTAALWLVGTSYTKPTVAIGSDGRAYRCNGTGVVGVNPVTDLTGKWVALNPDPLFVAALVCGVGVYPGWDFEAQDTDGTNPPTDPTKPEQLVWSRGTERYKALLTWGTTGGELDAITQAAMSYSYNSGGTYTAIATADTLTITYSSDGEPISAAWS